MALVVIVLFLEIPVTPLYRHSRKRNVVNEIGNSGAANG